MILLWLLLLFFWGLSPTHFMYSLSSPFLSGTNLDLGLNIYLMFQVDLLLSFCSEMGFSSVILVGHDDGGLLALRAAQRVQTSMNSYNVSNDLLFLCQLNLYTPKEKGKKRIFLISPFRQKKDHIIGCKI